MNEVSLAWPAGRFELSDVDALRAAFESHYQHRFGAGTIRPETPLELISFRAEAIRHIEKPTLARLFDANGGGELVPKSHREVYQHGTGWVDACVYDFASLRPGPTIDGPAVIERDNTTVWLPPGAVAALDVYGNLEIDPGAGA